MKKKNKSPKPSVIFLVVTGVVLIPILALWAAYTFPKQIRYTVTAIGNVGQQIAAVILAHDFKSVAEIQSRYDAGSYSAGSKVRILLVPGHEPTYGGAEYGKLRERDINVELAQYLQGFLANDPHYQVSVTRDTQDWAPAFADYFKNDWDEIIAWQKAARAEFSHLVAVGSVTKQPAEVKHNRVAPNAALRLYGITKWANENDIDIVLHIHFNDNPDHHGAIGDHSGFAIYVPATQYGNSSTTKSIAEDIFAHLKKYNPVSDLKAESGGIIDEPDLIAIGANNTANAASMLIEYSYIYEPQIVDPVLRSPALKDLAYGTYLGLHDFFEPDSTVITDDSALLPHTWDEEMSEKSRSSEGILSLQTALIVSGDYPPKGRTLNDCPRTGSFGSCTRAALKTFQAKNGITGEIDKIGPKTLEALNSQY